MRHEHTADQERQAPRPPSARSAARVAWALWAGYLAFCTLVPLLLGRFALNPGHATADVFEDYWLVSVALFPFISVGALIAARQPANRIGWVMLAGVLALNPAFIAEAYRFHPDAVDGTPLAGWLIWSDYWIAQPGQMLVFGALPLLFPTGRLPSPRWAAVGWLMVVAVLATTFVSAFGGAAAADELVPSVVQSARLAGWIAPMDPLASAALTAALLGTVASLLVRFHDARGIERQQIKWFAGAATLTAAGLVMALFAWPNWGVGFIAAIGGVTVGLPVAIGVAMLRYRLYDIDRIINRALVYGALTTVLLGAYLVSVIGLSSVARAVAGGSSPLVTAASTLAAAALFQPLRHRIQSLVDRRFYRRKYDAVRVVERFSAHLRDEVDLAMLEAELRTAVGEAMQPAHVSIWLRPGASHGGHR